MDIYTIISIVFTLAVIISYLNYRFIKIQSTTAVTIGSFLFSAVLLVIGLFGFTGLEHNIELMLRSIPFHSLLLNGMLSFLLFAGALRIDINHLKVYKWEIGVLACLGTVISTFLIGFLLYFALPLLGVNVHLIYCLLFGALISPTDPIAVLATFKELGAPTALKVIVEGEALFNDGLGIVIFLTLYQIAFTHTAVTWQTTTILFFAQAIGGIAYGAIIGAIAHRIIKPIDDHMVVILITLLIVTAGYTLARYLNISGPLAMVVAGIFIGNRRKSFSIPTKTIASLFTFWELIENILNTVLFLLIGLEFLIVPLNKYILLAALLAIPLVLSVRAITIAIPMSLFKILRRYPQAITRILVWGGLRGGLALALALSLPENSAKPIVLSMTYAVVAFAVIVQGLTITPMLRLHKVDTK